MGEGTAIRPRICDGDGVKHRDTTRGAAKAKREAMEYARGASLWMNLRTSMDDCRARGISMAEAKRLLQQRLAAKGRGSAKKTTQGRKSAR
jgi:hypothetical protein